MIEKVTIGDCLLYLGDCVEVLPTLYPIELVVTSPPYDGMRKYGDSFSTFDWRNVVDLVSHSVSDGGVIVWNVADQHVKGSETGTSLEQALRFKKNGLNLHDTMIYLKPSFSFPESNRYPQTWEYMFILSNGKPKTFNPIKDRKNIYSGTVVHGTQRQVDGSTIPATGSGKILADYGVRHNAWLISNRERYNTGEHPAPFPLALAVDHIKSWSNEGETVMDPFMGSGTTGVACAKMRRKFIGIELEPKYFDIACKRIEEAYKQPDMFVETPAKPTQETCN